MGLALTGLSGLSGVMSGGTLVTVTDQEFAIAASADDGHLVRGPVAAYPPTGSITVVTNNASIQVRKNLSGGNYTVQCGLLRFNTGATLASLPGLSITGAKLKFHCTQLNDSADNRSFDCEWYPWSTAQTSDYTDTPSSTAGSFDFGTITNAAVNTLTLTSAAANVSTSGYTGLRLHVSGGAPSTFNQISLASYDNVSAQPVPKLLLSYTYIA